MFTDEYKVNTKIECKLDNDFAPAKLANEAYLADVEKSGKGVPLAIALERNDGYVSVYKTKIFAEDAGKDDANNFYVERLVKTLLWSKGGWKVTICGQDKVAQYIKDAYKVGGIREFDAKFMSRVYEKPFVVESASIENTPAENESAISIGKNLDGCRIGFDAGGSDRKVAAVVNGEAVYTEEVIWHPKTIEDPDYHYEEILKAMKTAASHMDRVDAIGVSSAGVYVANRVMVASLFIKVPEDVFDEKVKDIFLRVRDEIGDVPIEVVNDGDVTALAGAMSLDDTGVMGIAMGTSEAGGYVDIDGNVTGWLNEFAFMPIDYNQDAMVDEWSGDYGCGVKYFSQDGVIKLAPKAGITFEEGMTPAEKLAYVQQEMKDGNEATKDIFDTIGCYLGYSIAYYADFYDIKHLLILGRVTSGEGGEIILKVAQKVLDEEFPDLAKKIELHIPDEKSKRVGQSIAAASLPKLK